MPSGEVIPADPYGDECSLHVKEMVLQREVEIEVENIDKAGNFIGYLFVENTNLSLHLVQEGFASMHFTADRSPYANQIKNAEDNAKNAKKRIWTNYAGEEDSVSTFLLEIIYGFRPPSPYILVLFEFFIPRFLR